MTKQDVENKIETFITSMYKLVPTEELPKTLVLSDEEYQLLTGNNPLTINPLRICTYMMRWTIISNYQHQVKTEAARLNND